MTSYEKKQRIISIYELMTDNLEIMINDLIEDPAAYIPTDYAEKPEVSQEIRTFAKEVGRTLRSEIIARMNEIYRL